MCSSTCESEPVRVLVADSTQMQSQLLTSALRRHPQFDVRTCQKNWDALTAITAQTALDVAIITTNLGVSSDGDLALIRRLHLSHPKVAKVLLVESCSRDVVINAFRSGARGIFCYENTPVKVLYKCIRCVHSGQVWANAQQLSYLLDAMATVESLRILDVRGSRLLTGREQQVVALVADGLSNREIAGELSLTQNTVKTYLFRIFEKLGISSRVELVLYAVNHSSHRAAEWMAGNA